MNALGLFTGADIRRPDAGVPECEFRQGGRLLLLDLTRHRRTTGPRRSRPQVGRRGDDVLDRPRRIRRAGRRAQAARRQGLAPLRDDRQPRPDRHPEDQVRRLRDHHAQQVRHGAGCRPGRSGAAGLRLARSRDTATQARQAAGGVAVCPPGRRRCGAAADFRSLNQAGKALREREILVRGAAPNQPWKVAGFSDPPPMKADPLGPINASHARTRRSHPSAPAHGPSGA